MEKTRKEIIEEIYAMYEKVLVEYERYVNVDLVNGDPVYNADYCQTFGELIALKRVLKNVFGVTTPDSHGNAWV